MLDQPPFREHEGLVLAEGGSGEVGVIVPTRNRPAMLGRCLDALAATQKTTPFRVYVCDSSGPEVAAEVEELCARHSFVELVSHDRRGAAAARNVGTLACDAELVVSVDDDIYVEPDAIDALVRAYREAGEPSAVAGTVAWTDWSSRPLVMRRTGCGREAEPGEPFEFLISALILYPRKLALAFPWNERLWPYEDRYASLVWRAAGARLAFAPEARAKHDAIENSEYPVACEADRIYVNLIDAALVTRSPGRLLGFEFLGFAARAKRFGRSPAGAWGIVRAWLRGHMALLRDLPAVRRTIAQARRHRLTASP